MKIYRIVNPKNKVIGYDQANSIPELVEKRKAIDILSDEDIKRRASFAYIHLTKKLADEEMIAIANRVNSLYEEIEKEKSLYRQLYCLS